MIGFCICKHQSLVSWIPASASGCLAFTSLILHVVSHSFRSRWLEKLNFVIHFRLCNGSLVWLTWKETHWKWTVGIKRKITRLPQMKKRRSKFVLEVETGIILFATLHSHFPLLFLPFKLKEEKDKNTLQCLSVSLATSVLFNPFYSVF